MRGPRLAVFLVALLLPSAALADRVVLGPIRGDRSGAIQRRLERALSDRLDVIPWDDFLVGYREIGAGTPNADAVRQACRNVRARRVVLGDVNSRRTVHLTALSCTSGELDVELEVLLYNGLPERTALLDALAMLVFEDGGSEPAAGRRNVRVARDAGGASVVDQLLEQRTSDAEQTEETTEEITEETTEETTEELPPEVEAPAANVHDSAYLATSFGGGGGGSGLGAGLDEEHPGAEVGSDAEVEAGAVPASSLLEASAGFVMATRSLTVPILDNTPVAYSGGGYTELGVQVTAFPIALAAKQATWARMIGLTGSIYQGVFMPKTPTGLSTSAVDGNVGLVGRLELGTSPIFDLRPSISWGWWGFAITPNADVSTFNYRFFRFGLDARVHLLDRRVSLGVSGGWRMVSDLGEAATAYGNQSAGAGWDVGASASIILAKILEVSAGGEIVNYDGVYGGVGVLGPERQAVSSSDSYPRGFLRAGVVLR